MSRRILEAERDRAQAECLALRQRLQDTLQDGLPELVGRTVVVHQNGPSIQGVLIAAHRDCLVVGLATHLDAKTELGGEVVIPRAQGVFVQIPDSEAA